jgi:hypothetical protein
MSHDAELGALRAEETSLPVVSTNDSSAFARKQAVLLKVSLDIWRF